MKFRKAAVVAVLATSAVGVAAGTANAAPTVSDPAPAIAAPAVPASPQQMIADASALVNRVIDPASVPADAPAPVLNTPIGSVTVADGQLRASNTAGQVVAAAPVAPVAQAAEVAVPDQAKQSLSAVAGDPNVVNDVAARPVPVTPVLDYGWKTEAEREQWAFARAKDSISTAASVATPIGIVGGGVVGCAVFGALGAGVGAITVAGVGGIPGALGGCILGSAVGVGIGAIAANALITLPVAIAAGIGYYQTVTSPFVPPKPAAPQKVVIVDN